MSVSLSSGSPPSVVTRAKLPVCNLARRATEPVGGEEMPDHEAGDAQPIVADQGDAFGGDGGGGGAKAPGWYPSPTIRPTRSTGTARTGRPDAGGPQERAGFWREMPPMRRNLKRGHHPVERVCPPIRTSRRRRPDQDPRDSPSTWASSCSLSAGSPSCTDPSANGYT